MILKRKERVIINFLIIIQERMENHLRPLFWQHGEKEGTLRNEIVQMKSAHINEFIVESRPHPDFLGPGWWRDLDIIIDEAKKQAN